jgi:hypothetical protein
MTTPAAPHRFPLRPRFRGLAWGSIGLGGALAGIALWTPPVVLVTGVCGLVLGGAYLLSPTWRLAVVVNDEALTLMAGDTARFTLPWSEVQKVIASADTKTCFVDGGSPERRIMIPGDGAPAPYRIERREALYDFVLAHVPADKVEPVALITDRMT